jgi:hypothetical protein
MQISRFIRTSEITNAPQALQRIHPPETAAQHAIRLTLQHCLSKLVQGIGETRHGRLEGRA